MGHLRARMQLLCPWLLLCAPLAVQAAASPRLPCCRKSPELHRLIWPDGSERLVAFGGKGFEWSEKKKGNLSGESEKKKVTFFGDAWAFDVAGEEWTLLAGAKDELRPRPRWKPSSTTFDGATGLIVFGGCKGTAPSGVLNDLWVLRPQAHAGHAAWTQIFTSRPPAKRRGHIACATADHLVVIGGKSWNKKRGAALVLVDVWSLPLSSIRSASGAAAPLNLDRALAGKRPSQWTRGTDFPGGPRWGTTGTNVKGPHGKEFIACFGGRIRNDKGPPFYTYFNELWLYDFGADSWRLAHPGGTGAPHPRDHHGATALAGDLYVFGGRTWDTQSANSVIGDLWTYSLADNLWRIVAAESTTLAGGPSDRFMPGVAGTTWQGSDALAVFGGEMLPGSTKTTSLNDLWVFTPNKAWQELSTPDCSAESVMLPPPVQLAEEPQGSETASRGLGDSPLLLGLGGAACSLALWTFGRRRGGAPRDFLATEVGQADGLDVAYEPLG